MKRVVIAIQSTDATLASFKALGLWERQKPILERYATRFAVMYYTSDWESGEKDMPAGVSHKKPFLSSRHFGLRHLLFYVYLMASAFKWRRMDCVIRVFGVTIPVLPVLKWISGKKMVVSYQYDWAEQTRANYRNIKHYLSRRIETEALNSADFIICTMAWLAEKLENYYKIPRCKFEVIPNIVNLKVFHPGEKTDTIVYAGRLHWSKGIASLISAFKEFNQKHCGFKLIIIGDGEERDSLITLARDNERVVFLGSMPHGIVAKHFRRSRIFVLPTVTMEGHPRSLIEAMASGCICLASSVPGNRDVLTEANLAQNLFHPNDQSDLLKKLEGALVQDNSSLSLEFARNNYSLETLLERELELLIRFVC